MPRPQKPSLFNKVNGIVEFVDNPCNAPWSVYFETAVPAAGRALLTLVEFDFPDVVRGALRPKGLRQGRHGRRGSRGGRGLPGIPELGEMIGKAIGGTTAAQGRSVSQGVKNLWIVDGVVQRLLWYWLVVDVSVTFFYEWASAIQRSEFCAKQGLGNAHATSPDGATFFSVANAWTSIPTNQNVYETGDANAQNAAHTNGGKPFAAITSISATEYLIPGGRLEILTTVGGWPQDFNQGSPSDSDNKQEIISKWNGMKTPVVMMYRTNGGAFKGKADSFTFGL